MECCKSRIITDSETAKEFICLCIVEIGLGFHPDTAGYEYETSDRRPMFTDVESIIFDENLRLAFEHLSSIYKYSLSRMEDFYGTDH